MSEANERNKIKRKRHTPDPYSGFPVFDVPSGSSTGIVCAVSSVLSTSSVLVTATVFDPVVEGGGADVCVSSCSSGAARDG